MKTVSETTMTRHGIFFMLLAVFIFSSVNAVVKDVTASYPLLEMLFFRFAFALIPASFLVMKAGGLKTLKTKNMPKHFMCAIAGVMALSSLFGSFSLLPLADATAFSFASILFVTALSVPVLKERVEPQRWAAILIGFLGILIIARPTGDVLNIGALLGIIFAFGDAFVMVFARLLTRSDKSSTVVFFFSCFASLICLLALPFVWVTPNLVDTGKLIFLGLGGGTGQLCLTQAYSRAPAAVVAPMIYSGMLWGVLFGFIFWGEIPTIPLIIGSSIVVVCGLYIIYQENRPSQASVSK